MHSALRERMQFYLYSYKEPVRFPRNAISSVFRAPIAVPSWRPSVRRAGIATIARRSFRRHSAVVDGHASEQDVSAASDSISCLAGHLRHRPIASAALKPSHR